MDLQILSNLNAYFGLKKIMHTQIFRGCVVRSTKRQNQRALALCGGTHSIKLEEVILTRKETVAHKLPMNRKTDKIVVQ